MNTKDAEITRREFVSVASMSAMGLLLLEGCATEKTATPQPQGSVIVIGAGLGGLSFAARAAKAGFDVTVMERHYVPGGYATAFHRVGGASPLLYPLTGRKYTFEVSLHAAGFVPDSPANDVKRTRLPELYRLVAPDFDLVLPNDGVELFVKALTDRFPNEASGIQFVVTQMTGVTDETMRLARDGIPANSEFSRTYPFLAAVQNRTLAELLDARVSDPNLRGALACLWSYYGLPPSQLAAYYYALSTGGYIKYGAYYFGQRSRDLSERLAAVVKEHGGRVLLEKAVKSINVEHGAVTGVTCTDGKSYSAQAVISNANAVDTLQRMLPANALPADYVAHVHSLRPSISSFVVWLGLKAPIQDRLRNYEVYLTATNDPEKDYQACLVADAEHAPIWVTAYDNAITDYSESGTNTLTLMFACGYEPWRRFEVDYRAGRKREYQAEKARLARVLIRRVEERLIPGLSGLIDVMDVATPLTNIRYTGNPGGAIYGFEQCPENSGANRLNTRTPLRGLYLASAWATPGGGFVGAQAGGLNAFLALSEDVKTIQSTRGV